MPTPIFSMKVTGEGQLRGAIEIVKIKLRTQAKRALTQAVQETAEFIQTTFTGDRKGFRNNTGALRRSIHGDFLSESSGDITVFIAAGDDQKGSNGVATRDYIRFVEFPEFRRGAQRNTAFLRPGVQMRRRAMAEKVARAISPRNLV